MPWMLPSLHLNALIETISDNSFATLVSPLDDEQRKHTYSYTHIFSYSLLDITMSHASEHAMKAIIKESRMTCLVNRVTFLSIEQNACIPH